MAVATTIAAIATLTDVLSRISKFRKGQKFEKETKAFTKKEERRGKIEARKAALGRAIGAPQLFRVPEPRKAPEAPSTELEDLISGLSAIAAQTAARKAGRAAAGGKKALLKPAIKGVPTKVQTGGFA